MKNTFAARFGIAAFVILSLAFSSCGSTRSLSTEESIDGIMADFAVTGAPGAAVLVMDHDSVVFKKGYGVARLGMKNMGTTGVYPNAPTFNGDAIRTATNFRLASMTKEFTAAAILKLKEQGKLSLDDKILKFFTDFPLYGKEITVRNLLNHTSGLVDYEDFVPDTQQYQVLDADCLKLMFQAESLYFPAGSKYRYSNSGYALLALIVERASGQRYADFTKQYLFDAAGMTSTVAFENGISVVANRAYGHSRTENGWMETDQSNTSAVLGDGGIYSNVEDMARWVNAMWNFRILPEAQQREAWSDATVTDGSSIPYGMGWHTETYRGIQHPHHGGSTRGFRNHILVFPERKFAVIILTNRNEGDPIIQAKRIADLYWEQR